MKVGTIYCLIALMLALHPDSGRSATNTADESATEIKKTFDYGTLIEHTVSVQMGHQRVSMRFSQRRETEGAPAIANAYLTFYADTQSGKPLLTVPVFETLLAEMISALNGRFGADLKLKSLGSAGFMGIKDVERKSILAFDGYAPWEAYLEAPATFSQKQIYDMVRARWRNEDIFEAIPLAFGKLGYDAVFSGFEKLFVFPAGKCSFYRELEDLGINKTDRFPYPGTISFSLKPKN